MSRRNARKNAFVLLFQMEFNAAEEQEQMTDLFFAEQDEVVTEEDKAYTMAAVEGTRANLEAIDAVIDSFAKGWNTQRMNRVDLAILRLAVYELKYSKDAPVGVVINEAVELAKKYQVDLYLGRTLEEERKGTTVMSQPVFFEDMPVTGISIKEHCAIVTFRHMEYNAGTAASIFALIARNNLNLDMINQTILDGKVAFSFSCSDEQASELEAHLKEDPDASALVLDIRRDLTQLSLVGVGMATHTGVATQVFDTLARCGIPYYQITTSEISISFTIDPQNKEKAVQALAQAFHL